MRTLASLPLLVLASSAAAQNAPLRSCGTPDFVAQFAGVGGQDAPSDCSLSSTTIKAQYEPTFVYDLPVVFHVIQSSSGTGFVPMTEIVEQMEVINEDFRALAGTPGAPGTDCLVQFHLATADPSGNPTTGVTYSTNSTWFNDGGTYWSSLAWDPSRYVNVYTNNAGGFLGYVPWLPQGGSPGSSSDRVVVLWSTVGKFAPYGPPYHMGRTLTHELGHYLGLYHTFEGGCGTTSCYTTGDRICDTQREQTETFGCPGAKSSCSSTDPVHNYMDYSDDTCMWEFTPEQANRIRCTIENYRSTLPTAGLPTLATNPSPSSGASGVALAPTLSWSPGSGATSHDVYFGTDPSPDAGELVGNQTGTTYAPGSLLAGTTYWWRIDEVNGAGTTTGATWSFTTQAGPPAPASSPSPIDGATNVSPSSVLSWTAGSGATSHDVYFGTDPTPDATELVGNQGSTTYNPGGLLGSTTYWWRIDEVNGTGTTPGPVWSFTTQASTGAVQVTGVSPTSIEALQVGSGQVVTITGSGFSPSCTVEVNGVPLFGIPSPYTIVDANTITFDPPLPTALGPATVTVKDAGSQDSTTLTYVHNQPPALQAGDGDEPVSAFSFSGLDVTVAGAPGDLFIVLGSVSNQPSIFPGLVTLDIGNGLTNIYQIANGTIPAKGWTKFNVPMNLPSPLLTFYLEAVTVAPVPVLPVADTNTQEVQFLF